MQNTSQEFKNSIRDPSRLGNRGYIRIYIGVVNSDAQSSVSANDTRNEFTYYSDIVKPFRGFPVDYQYATCEENFSHVDGTMRFTPANPAHATYNNGIVTERIRGTVYISFGGVQNLDIKGLTIDFGECYPVDFSVENDSGTHYYTDNNRQNWVTEDVFYGTSYFKITPARMVNGMNRLRIHQFTCGIINIFTNAETLSYTMKDYVSTISDTIPSQDMTVTVDNQSLYYSVDNPESALSFMEIGQEVKVSFGYDVTGNGDIEWLPDNTCYLKTWIADDRKAKFTATDRFDYLTGTYYRGRYRENGISLYDLAEDVLYDAGITDQREFFIDPYLKKIIVYNPMPVVKHSEALQIIANAGRCTLFQDRKKRICLTASFIPDMSISVNNETKYSHIQDVLNSADKDGYAICSNDFSAVDGSLFFMPENGPYLNTGYVSGSLSDAYGVFSQNPKINIDLEAGYSPFGVMIKFRNVAPEEFVINTYYLGKPVQNKTITQPQLTYVNYDQLDVFDRMEILFTKGKPHTRITIDNIKIGDITDYELTGFLFATPSGSRQPKIKSIGVERSIYSNSADEAKELSQGEISLTPENTEYTVYFTKPCYGLAASVVENELVTCEIVEFSSYYAKMRFIGVRQPLVIKYSVMGFEYLVEKTYLTVMHDANGEEKKWSNPLISTTQHAQDLEEWLAAYYIGDIEYQIKYWGDPSIDANDLFYLHLKERGRIPIRGYEHTLNFSGGWSGSMKARKVKWKDGS